MNNPEFQASTFAGTSKTRISTSEELLEIDTICSQFEQAWNTAKHQTIEQCLPLVSHDLREPLLESMIRSEIELRGSDSVSVKQEEFESRFPAYLSVVRTAFSPIAEELEPIPFARNVSTLFSKPRESSATSDDSPLPNSVHPKTLGPYEIISEFARGGMGIIYRARHQRLDRVVALKVIKSGLDANEQELARFQTEAQVIAALEHPNIVPIFEIGECSGYHYFSMPLIEGVNLAMRIQEGPLPPSEAAGVVQQIAIATEFAHKHGVIHRDLKPSNILLDHSGVVRVTDFGLAKLVRADREKNESQELTLTGQVVGTPAYMAPEQSMGSPSKRSDLYSIGAILYALLTGRPPFQAATPLETLRQLQDKEPVEPRMLNAQIPRDLNTITLKCLSKNPEARYSSSVDLAEDLDRYLANRPILARPISKIEHGWRWAKRQPVVASLIAAIFISLAMGFGISLWFFTIARTKERLASENFDFAKGTVKKYLTDVASSPELGEKGLEQLRQNLLRTAKDFYQQLQSRSGNDKDVRERLADSHFNLSIISNELGEMEEARSQSDQMIDAYRHLSKHDEGNVSIRRSLAIGLQHRGSILNKTAKADEAERDFQESIDLFRKIYADTQSPSDQVRIASALAELGYSFTGQDRENEELRLFEEVEKICTELLPKSDQLIGIEESSVLLKAYHALASDLQRHNQLDRSEKWLKAAVELLEKLIQVQGPGPNLQFDLARAHKSLNLLYIKRQRFEEANVEFEKGDQIFQRLVNEHPTVVQFLDGRANLWINLGALHISRGAWEEAEQSLKQAVALQSALVAKQSDIYEYRLGLAVAYSTLGLSLTKQAKNSDAETALRSAIQHLDKAASQRPGENGVLFIGLSIKSNLATLYRSQNNYSDAIDFFEEAVKTAELLMKKNPSAVDTARNAATIYHNLAITYRKTNEFDKSETATLKCRQICEEWIDRNPTGVAFHELLLNGLIVLAEIHLGSNRHEESIEPLQKALAVVEQLIRTSEEPTRFLGYRGSIQFHLGQLEFNRGNMESALDWNTKGIDDQRSDLNLREGKDSSAARHARELLCTSYCAKARILFRKERIEEALEACRLGLTLETGHQADSLRSLYSRLLAKLSDSQGALQTLSEIDSDQELSSQAYIDVAAVYATLASHSEDQASGFRDRRILESLAKAARLDPILVSKSVNDPEFARLRDWPELRQLW